MLKTKTTNGSSDPFADNDDDVARIAKELEAKYGNSYARGRGRRKKDEVDIGMGYDENDSFIDNTEAVSLFFDNSRLVLQLDFFWFQYDELLPEEAETLEGGFYINSGALEFKNLNKKLSTRRTDAIIKMPERSRKRVVSSSSDETSDSSSDSSNENELDEVATNNKVNNNNGQANDDDDENDDDEGDDDDDDDDDSDSDSDSESIDGSDTESESIGGDSATSSVNANNNNNNLNAKEKFKKNASKRPKPSDSVKQSVNSAGPRKSSNKLNVASSSSSNSPRPAVIDISDTEERQAQAQALKKVVKTTTVKDMLKAKRDSFLKSQGQAEGASKGVVNGELKCIPSVTVISSSDNDDTDSASEQGKSDKLPKGKDGIDSKGLP